MLDGDKTPEEIIASVKNGIYAVSFGGGQVDITSGKFVFGCTEAYMIENGRIGAPVKGAMLIGNGPDAMQRISMIGNDLQLDTGMGNCGKGGQWVPVGVGQPHLRMDQMTVGGTAQCHGFDMRRPEKLVDRHDAVDLVATLDEDAQIAPERHRIAGHRSHFRHIRFCDLDGLGFRTGARRIEDQSGIGRKLTRQKRPAEQIAALDADRLQALNMTRATIQRINRDLFAFHGMNGRLFRHPQRERAGAAEQIEGFLGLGE
eukprot:gene29988-36963_t